MFGLHNPAIRGYLERGDLLPLLSTRDQRVIDIMINGPGEGFLQIAGRPGYERISLPNVDQPWAENLCRTLSAATSGNYDPHRCPLLLSDLAGGHRFSALTGPPTANGLAISIRVRRHVVVPLENFGLDERAIAGFRRAERNRHWVEERQMPVVERLRHVILRRGNIVISGGTGTGKTTLLNTLARWIPDSERIIKVEDVNELYLTQPNTLGLVVARREDNAIGHNEIIDSILRFNPDRIFISELSIHNAAAAFRLFNTGHGGGLLSVHANDPLEFMEAWRRNYELSSPGATGGAVVSYLARNIDAIVQIDFDTEDPEQQMRRSAVVFKGEDGTLDMPWRELLGVDQAGMVTELKNIGAQLQKLNESAR